MNHCSAPDDEHSDISGAQSIQEFGSAWGFTGSFFGLARCCWDPLLPIVQNQGFIIHLDIASTLRAFAEEIACTIRAFKIEAGSSELVQIETKCARLSEVLGFPLTLMHITYFVRPISEVPLHSCALHCPEDFTFIAALDAKYFLENIVVLGSANSIRENSGVLVKIIRRKSLYIGASIEEIRLFTMSEHGIILFGSILVACF